MTQFCCGVVRQVVSAERRRGFRAPSANIRDAWVRAIMKAPEAPVTAGRGPTSCAVNTPSQPDPTRSGSRSPLALLHPHHLSEALMSCVSSCTCCSKCEKGGWPLDMVTLKTASALEVVLSREPALGAVVTLPPTLDVQDEVRAGVL